MRGQIPKLVVVASLTLAVRLLAPAGAFAAQSRSRSANRYRRFALTIDD